MIKLFSIVMARDSFELAAQLVWWMDFSFRYESYSDLKLFANKISICPVNSGTDGNTL